MRRFICIAVVCAVCLPQLTLADDVGTLRISVGAGSSVWFDRSTDDTLRDTGFALLFGGEYRATRNVAVAVNLFSLGNIDFGRNAPTSSFDVTAADILGRLYLPTSESFDLYGQAGIGGYRLTNDDASDVADDFELALSLGGGLQFRLGKQSTINAELRYFGARNDQSGLALILSTGVEFR